MARFAIVRPYRWGEYPTPDYVMAVRRDLTAARELLARIHGRGRKSARLVRLIVPVRVGEILSVTLPNYEG